MLNQNIYQVFIRNHTQEGSFQALIRDLERIKSMNFGVLYLMPFHPISVLNRKGTYGSPYAIADYYEVSPDYGTKDDLKELLDAAHGLGLNVVMDIVFNHAGADHVYTRSHPQYFILDEKGNPTRKVADWSDIVDFDYTNKNLWAELKKVLHYWADFGVDGFRCDVASLVPYEFWLEAISSIKATHPNLKWFSESIDLNFREALILNQETVLSDLDILRLFDGSYDYDVWPQQILAMKNPENLKVYSELLNYRYGQQLKNKAKWHFIENHDQVRIRANGLSDKDYKMWLSFILLYPGMGFIYAGQEAKVQDDASFFEKQAINLDLDEELVGLITSLNRIKQEWVNEGELWAKTSVEDNVFKLLISTLESEYLLLLNFNQTPVLDSLKEGYNLVKLNDTPVTVNLDMIQLNDQPILLKKVRDQDV